MVSTLARPVDVVSKKGFNGRTVFPPVNGEAVASSTNGAATAPIFPLGPDAVPIEEFVLRCGESKELLKGMVFHLAVESVEGGFLTINDKDFPFLWVTQIHPVPVAKREPMMSPRLRGLEHENGKKKAVNRKWELRIPNVAIFHITEAKGGGLKFSLVYKNEIQDPPPTSKFYRPPITPTY